MDFTSTMARLVEREGWNHVLATLHNLALAQGRASIAKALASVCYDDPDATRPSENEIDHDSELA